LFNHYYTSNWAHATCTYEILKLQNIYEDGCYVQLYFYDKLSNPKPSDMSDSSVRHVWGTRFDCIRRDPNTLSFYCLFFSSPVGGGPDDSLTISSLLLPTCKVCEMDSSHHRIGPLPIGFVLYLLRHDNFIVFNLVFSFMSFFYIASRFLSSRYSYDQSVKCLWVLCRFKRD
jgi:hypothetical protein